VCHRVALALLYTMDGDFETEREIHERFAHLRFERKEQFMPGPDLMEFIGLPVLITDKAKAVEVERRGFKPMRFELSVDMYRRLERQAEDLGVSRAIYARMKVIQGIKDDEKEESL
jgi:hypothetical protein